MKTYKKPIVRVTQLIETTSPFAGSLSMGISEDPATGAANAKSSIFDDGTEAESNSIWE